MPRQQEITVEFLRERNVFENGEPGEPNYSRVVIATVKNGDGKEATIKGEAAEGALVPGLPYRFYGHTRIHLKHGPQFNFSTFVAEQPATEKGIVAYLSQLTGPRIGVKRGIGKGTAWLLWEEYKADAVSMLREDPEVVAGTIPRLNLDVAEAASEWLKLNQRIEKTKIDLIGLLDGRGFPKKTIVAVIAKYGSAAAETIRHNPYLLMQFRGCGFSLTDKMYLDLGKSPWKLKRQALCAWYTLLSDGNGHTWYDRQFVERGIRAGVGSVYVVNVDRAITLALRAGLLAEHRDDNGLLWLAEGRKALNEERLAEYVADALTEVGEWPTLAVNPHVSHHQSCKLLTLTTRSIACLSGSPGTGKTFCASALTKAIIEEHGHDSVAVCAPTGKAAVRITEAMAANGVYVIARTIHSLLGVISADDGWHFDHHEGNPLDFRFVIIDESSMIDTDLMASLFAARASDTHYLFGTHYLFVGDHRQLAPVGHGCPFLDLQRGGVPTGELTEVQRNSGMIVQACAEIRDRKVFKVAKKVNMDDGDNLVCVGQGSPETQIEMLEKLYSDVTHMERFSPIWDVQIVVAVNNISPLSRTALNKHLQGLLNPHGKQIEGNPFRIGDKIINLKNGLLPSLDGADANEDGNVYVANGEQAEAVEVEPARTIARLESPSRLVVIPHGQQKGVEGDEGAAVGNWDLAYAISVHKSQGSEWPIVAVMIDESAGAKYLCTRNWLYTAISRAKSLCLLIGRKSTADQMVRRDGLRRKTFLTERILGKDAGVEVVTEPEPLSIALSEAEFQELFASV